MTTWRSWTSNWVQVHIKHNTRPNLNTYSELPNNTGSLKWPESNLTINLAFCYGFGVSSERRIRAILTVYRLSARKRAQGRAECYLSSLLSRKRTSIARLLSRNPGRLQKILSITQKWSTTISKNQAQELTYYAHGTELHQASANNCWPTPIRELRQLSCRMVTHLSSMLVSDLLSVDADEPRHPSFRSKNPLEYVGRRRRIEEGCWLLSWEAECGW